MPTYEYECDACRHRFEQFQSITANPLRKCPECGRQKLRRLIGIGGAVIFKGGGFYETDYRSEGYRKAEEADRSSSEAKPEAKSETPKPDSGSAPAKAAPAAAGSEAGTAPASSDKATESKPSGPAPSPGTRKAKSHAREGRGVGNLKRSSSAAKAKTSAAKGRTRRS